MAENCEIEIETLETSSKDFKYFENLVEENYKKWVLNTESENSNSQDELRLKFWKFHQFVAMKSLFPKYSKLKDLESDVKSLSEEEIVDCKIVTGKNGKLKFLDNELRDFFIADYITKCLKSSDVKDGLLNIYASILTNKKFGAIRAFINDAVEVTSLHEIYDKMNNSFNLMKTFPEFFVNNLENLVDFVIKIVISADHEKMKKVVNRDAICDICETKDPKMFNKFQEFLCEFYNEEELKAILMQKSEWNGTMLHTKIYNHRQIETFKNLFSIYRKSLNDEELLEIIALKSEHCRDILHIAGRSSMDDVFVFVLEELDKIQLKDEIRKILSSLGDVKQNLLQSASYSLHNLDTHKLIWKIYPKYFDQKEMSAFINYINDHDNNLLFDLINNTSENADFIWNQMKIYLTHEEQVNCLITERCCEQNIIQRTDHNCNSEEIRTWVKSVLQDYGLPIPQYTPNSYTYLMDNECEIHDQNLEDNAKDFKEYKEIAKDHFKKWTENANIDFWKFHQSVAVKTLFSKNLNALEVDVELAENDVIACGLVTRKDEDWNFLDKNMQKFFVADYIIKSLKSSNLSQELLEIFVEILTDKKFGIILRFINEAIEDNFSLVKIENQMQNFISSFYRMNNFSEYFAKNLENLVDFITKIIFNADREKMKLVITKDSIFNARETKMIGKLEEFLSEFYSNDELKEILNSEHDYSKTMLHSCLNYSISTEAFKNLWTIYRKCLNDHELLKILTIKSCGNEDMLHTAGRYSDEIFILLLEEIGKIPLRDEVRQSLKTLGNCQQNLLQTVSYDLQSLESHKVLWKIYPKYFDRNEMLELINYINSDDNNLLYDIVHNTRDNADYIWNQMKNFMTHEEQVQCLTTKRSNGQNIIQRTYHNYNSREIRRWVESVLQEYGLPIPRSSRKKLR